MNAARVTMDMSVATAELILRMLLSSVQEVEYNHAATKHVLCKYTSSVSR